jgi:FAD/FMN-containing dehydrogenase
MSKVAHYLQEHLVGEVMTSTDARRYFSTDGSILQLPPALIVYPRNENDVRKTCRFSWQLAERGRIIPVTARGSGTDQTGASLSNGILLVFPAHMHQIVELDIKHNTVTVEPGINFGKLQQTLHTHGRFVPPYPPGLEYKTIGGAIGNNSSGQKSVKYGDMKNYIRGLRVVLANGEVIETGRLSKRELSKKLGLATFEGEIYRSLDTLLEEQHELIENLQSNLVKNNAGYNLRDIKRRDGTFDLTPLMAGSQSTLGIVTEAILDTEQHYPETSLIMAHFDSLAKTENTVLELQGMSEPPSAIELVDGHVFQQVHNINPNQLKDIVAPPFPPITLLIEFEKSKHMNKQVKQAERILGGNATHYQIETELDRQQLLWKLRQTPNFLLAHNEGLIRSVPLTDAAVPIDRLKEFLDGLYSLLEAANIKPSIWGHAGEGNLHIQPRLNIGQVGDRQKAFRFLDEFNKLVIKLDGTISAEAGDGRLHTPYLEDMYGPELYALMQKVKNIFDPYGTLNPGVKFGTSVDDLKSMVRSDYGREHLYDHLPRT